LRALIEFGIEYFFRSEYDKALDYYFRAADVATEINDEAHLSECWGEIGIVYKNQGKFDLALEYQQKAIAIAVTINEEDWVAICNINIGNIYKAKGFLIIAQDYYMKALKTFEELGQSRRVTACYMSIADLYFEQKNYDKALENLHIALNLTEQTGDRVRKSNIKLAIGNVYSETGNQQLAKDYYFDAIALYDTLGYYHMLDDVYKSLAISFIKDNSPNEALKYIELGLDLSEKENDNINIAELLGAKAQAYLMKNDFARALDFAEQSLVVATIAKSPRAKMNAYQKLYEVWDKKKNTAKTLEYFRLYSEMKDSLFIDEQYRAITEMDIKYQSEKKEQDIALLTEQNKVQELMISRRSRMIMAIAIVFLFSIIIGYYLLINTRLKARHKAVELENRLLRSQMNPHFIFNSLIAIQSYIYQKDPITAGDYLSKFAELVRTTLENSRVEFVLLEKELKMLEIYLQLQQLRFENKFSFTIEKDENIDIEAIRIPPMLTQPFIENAVEHGLRLKEDAGNIIIRFRQTEKDIEFSIEDNGVGREFAARHKKAKHSQSMATLITRERLEVMCKKFKRKFKLDVIDLKDNDGKAVGTRVVITMPYLENV
jgi:predicted negative regulator of RcsB-dependent stress response